MNITFISACEKRAIAKTQAVLDRFACRMGEKTWKTSLTREGLRAVRQALQKVATRQTAVACLCERDSGEIEPLWFVGSRGRFGEDWQTPVHVTALPVRQRTIDRETSPAWVILWRQLASMAGHFHDLGKNNNIFADKLLREEPHADKIRHEWLSSLMLDALMQEARLNGLSESSLDNAIERAIQDVTQPKIDKFDKSSVFGASTLNNASDVVQYAVATHHKLFSGKLAEGYLNAEAFINENYEDLAQKADPVRPTILEPAARFSHGTVKSVRRLVQRLNHISTSAPWSCQTSLFWRAMALHVRAALVLADHEVSARQRGLPHPMGCGPFDPDEKPYANSYKPDDASARRFNQTLEWHLRSVGERAAQMAGNMYRLPQEVVGLCEESIRSVQSPAESRVYAWQNVACDAISGLRGKHPKRPMLIAVIASTGSGKTRACARMASCASIGAVRWSALFNLRTLTLQTGSSYAKHLGLRGEEMSVVIGDAMSRAIFEATERARRETVDEMDDSLGEDVPVQGDGFEIPEWLQQCVRGDASLKAMIAAPVLVSTADYMVAAGDPSRQARHIIPMLRLMSADLILDEIDNYDSNSVAAMLRLVQLSGLFGRNVIASSATMTPALALALCRFYEHGAQMRSALLSASHPNSVAMSPEDAGFDAWIVSDRAEPSLCVNATTETFVQAFEGHVAQVMQALRSQEGKSPRRAVIAPVDLNEESFFGSIAARCLQLHDEHAWTDPATGKKMSVGLVRVASIGVARRVAKELRERLAGFHPKVACYHSQMFHGQRALLEADLDAILYRVRDPNAPAQHASVRAHLARSDVQEGIFIVVATPVEEVGRDHDFDWAVIEPSSTQSIVQTAGRVRRHRSGAVRTPNIAILNHNWRASKSKGQGLRFLRPGNESAEFSLDAWLASHEISSGKGMADLLCERTLSCALDARLRWDFDTHKMAAFDEASLRNALGILTKKSEDGEYQYSRKKPLSIWTQESSETSMLWMASESYARYCLRKNKNNWVLHNWVLRHNPQEGASPWMEEVAHKGGGRKFEPLHRSRVRCDGFVVTAQHWLCPSPDDVLRYMASLDIEDAHVDPGWMFEISVPLYRGSGSAAEIPPGIIVDADGAELCALS